VTPHTLQAFLEDARNRSARRSLLAVFAVGVALRLFRLTDESIWLDEGIAYHHATTLTARELLFWLSQRDPNPPLYFFSLHGWTVLAGTPEAVFRLPSVAAGAAAVPLLYLMEARPYSKRVGVLAAAFLSLIRFHIQYPLCIFASHSRATLRRDALGAVRGNAHGDVQESSSSGGTIAPLRPTRRERERIGR
jgi:hypothetical protein